MAKKKSNGGLTVLIAGVLVLMGTVPESRPDGVWTLWRVGLL
jgi:hypothetical protein